MRWAFFVDANLEPEVATILDEKGHRAEYSDYTLDEDADDEDDILPYVRQEELIVITADVKNFAAFDESRHEGVFYLNDHDCRQERWNLSKGVQARTKPVTG